MLRELMNAPGYIEELINSFAPTMNEFTVLDRVIQNIVWQPLNASAYF